MNWKHLVKAGVSIMAVAACFSAQAADGITVSIAPEKSSLNKDDDVFVRVTITNTSSSPQYILKWHTPFDGVEEALFDVTRDGVAVPYLGAHYKRPAPTAKDYYLLKPGASHSARVELSGLYDLSVTGDYAIRYHSAAMDILLSTQPASTTARPGAAARGIDEIASAPVGLWINGRLERGTIVGSPFELQKAPSQPGIASLGFSNCTASQQSTVNSAINAAKTMTNNAVSYLAGGTAGTRYTKWFGAYTSTRYTTVKSHFNAIKDGLDNKPVVVDCKCNQNYYAYVYPTQPYKIYVCKAFWTAPLTGTDSKGGTLIHEMSHFNAVAGTDDWVYGQSGAASLAISDPAKAVDNADSHEYFGENTPAL